MIIVVVIVVQSHGSLTFSGVFFGLFLFCCCCCCLESQSARPADGDRQQPAAASAASPGHRDAGSKAMATSKDCQRCGKKEKEKEKKVMIVIVTLIAIVIARLSFPPFPGVLLLLLFSSSPISRERRAYYHTHSGRGIVSIGLHFIHVLYSILLVSILIFLHNHSLLLRLLVAHCLAASSSTIRRSSMSLTRIIITITPVIVIVALNTTTNIKPSAALSFSCPSWCSEPGELSCVRSKSATCIAAGSRPSKTAWRRKRRRATRIRRRRRIATCQRYTQTQ